ncbi:twin-arginine translocase subunit TatC [Litorimonas sp. RW-G-Af-16]|uniref:twin-arginine translocase subunit TatC n=1 Tax=Litorimonas sp. RW-G-Af-16 TaxID=3241168 RepID=UPI00390CB7EB
MTEMPRLESDEVEASKAPLMEHLLELRSRLIKCVLAVILGCLICIPFLDEIISLLMWPFQVAIERYNADMVAVGRDAIDLELISTYPLETFFVKLKIALFGGIVLGFPVLSYQVYRFVAPGLYKNEKRAFLPYLLVSPLLFVAGASLVFFFIFPFVMQFALGQQMITEDQSIELLTKIADYLKLATTLFLAFGLSFQLPVILSLLGRAGIIRADTLKKGRKYALFGIAVFAAFVTPPDPFSQFILIAAIYLLYEVSIISVSVLQKEKPKPEVA